jgi:hypothetical protein
MWWLLKIKDMSKTILITLNNSGNDPGPYNIILLDAFNNVVPGGVTSITKTILQNGYQLSVPINVTKVRVQSTSGNCDDLYTDIIIPQ